MVAVVINAVIAGLLFAFSILDIETYGWGLFILVPLLIGLGTTVMYGYSKGVTAKRAFLLSFAALALYALGLLLSALEGAYCLLMAAPLGIILTVLGVLAGFLILKRAPGKAPSGMLAFIGIIPLTMWLERSSDLDVKPSKRGQFKLTALPNGNTLLEGATWYGHRIQPDFYWRWWSDHIIHKIHLGVLEHIKAQAEASK